MNQTTPNLFILGTPRSATTSVSKWLAQHPDIAMGRRKEPMYHAMDLPSPMSITDLDAYQALWSETDESANLVDASPWYLFSKEAAASIANMSPQSRFIVHLRDPVDLIGSLHAHHVFAGFEKTRDLEEAVFTVRHPDPEEFRASIDYLEVVRVSSQLCRFYEHFDEDRFVFVDFSSIDDDPAGAYHHILSRLGLPVVDLDEYPHLNRARHNRLPVSQRFLRDKQLIAARAARKLITKVNVVPGRPPVPARLRSRIIEVIRPDIEELAQMTGRDLTHWLA